MKEYYVYIVQCRDNSFYTGITSNLTGRLAEHNQGQFPKCYTFSRRPVKLVFHQIFTDPLDAIRSEKQIKGWSRAKKQALIDGDWEELRSLSKSRQNR
ncbi:MAG: GIY-YIG nuclease family protein [Calditrichia bacterium]